MRLLAWLNFGGFMGTIDPTLTHDPLDGAIWYHGYPGDMTYSMHELVIVHGIRRWKYDVGLWVAEPDLVSAWYNLHATGDADKYVMFADMQFAFVDSLFPG